MFKKYVFSLLGIILFVNVTHAQVSLSDRVADDAICENINNATYKAFLGVSDKKTGKTDVFQLQYFLITNRHASFTQATGFFGQGTRRAVQAFQRTHGINPTGTVGPMTRAKIFSLVCTGNGSANSATQTGSEVVAEEQTELPNMQELKKEKTTHETIKPLTGSRGTKFGSMFVSNDKLSCSSVVFKPGGEVTILAKDLLIPNSTALIELIPYRMLSVNLSPVTVNSFGIINTKITLPKNLPLKSLILRIKGVNSQDEKIIFQEIIFLNQDPLTDSDGDTIPDICDL